MKPYGLREARACAQPVPLDREKGEEPHAMERYGRLTAILAVVLLHQFALTTSRAQPPAAPAPSIPPPRPVASAERPWHAGR